MPIKNDESICYSGTTYYCIKPTSPKEYVESYQNLNKLKSLIENNDTHSQKFVEEVEELIYKQDKYMDNFVRRFGDFDNSILIGNISYLTKSLNMGIGELEDAIGLSAGYISRTAKEASKKKMSVDIVWKIAKFFKVDIKDLINKDLSVPDCRMDILNNFIDKLIKMTLADEMDWKSHGGFSSQLDEKYANMGLISETDDCEDVYHSKYNINYLSYDVNWLLVYDIQVYEKFNDDKDLVLIGFSNEKYIERMYCDFLLIWKEGNEDKWERMFCTYDDVTGTLSEKASDLLYSITAKELQPNISPKHRKMIANFLKGGE